MRAIKKLFICCLVFAFLGNISIMAQEEKPSAAAMAMDIPVRVIGIGVTVAGGVLFTVLLPFSLFSGSVGDTWDVLVVDPAKFTFVRPVGQFDDWREEDEEYLEEDSDETSAIDLKTVYTFFT